MTVQEAKVILEALFSDATGENYPYSDKFGQAMNIAIESMEELEQYRALGTVEELKEAREKQVAKKPHKYIAFDGIERNGCPRCYEELGRNEILYAGQKYCSVCGQALKWGEEDEQG